MRSLKALAPARIKWAIELLALETTSNVLEIGCGSGVAAQHIIAKLGRGSYMGVDQSEAAVTAAIARNKANASAGRAIFAHRTFNYEAHEPALFGKILAVNVNAFWTGDGKEILDVRRLMYRQSLFVQVYQPPAPEQRAKIARILKPRMAKYFGDVRISMRTIAGAPLLAVVATGEAPQKSA